MVSWNLGRRTARSASHSLSLRTRSQLVALSLLLCVVVSACDALWSRANREQLKGDLRSLFEKHSVVLADPVCTMLGRTRDAMCQFRASVDQVMSLVRGLRLEEPAQDSATSRLLDWIERTAAGGCRASTPFSDRAQTRVYQSARRAPELVLKDGSAFEYLVLYRHIDSDRICVQVSYAYG